MTEYFTITIDVEPDCTTTWQYSDPLTFHGVTKGIGERLQPLFNKYDTQPTYLINNVVLDDKESCSFFKSLPGRFELGTHLHSEFISPERTFENFAGKKGEANQCDLPPALEFEKMKTITRLFEERFNRKPTSFRAGRFSAGPNTIRCLEELGYKVDTSVTPHIKWHDKTRPHPVDYTDAQEQPYFLSNQSMVEPDEMGQILEVPVSIIAYRQMFRQRKLWLRPYMSEYKDFTKVISELRRSYGRRETVVYNMMFHQVEVLPKLSPYCKSEKECSSYLRQIEMFLAFCQRNNIQSVSLSDLYDIYQKA